MLRFSQVLLLFCRSPPARKTQARVATRRQTRPGGRPAAARRGHSEKGPAGAKGRAKKSAPKKKQVVAPAPQPRPAGRARRGDRRHRRHRQRHGADVAGRRAARSRSASFPAAVGRASSSDIQRGGDPSVPRCCRTPCPSVILSDAQGNVFQRKLQYRGFEASPVNGAAQGIAVYQNGVRINEVLRRHRQLGLPAVQCHRRHHAHRRQSRCSASTPSAARPSIAMRDGFNFQGAEFDTRAGSYGRIQGSVAPAETAAPWAVFVAVEGIKDDGFRDFSEAEIKRMYADLGVKGDGKRVPPELHGRQERRRRDRGCAGAAPRPRLGAHLHLAADHRQRDGDGVVQRLGEGDARR